MVLGGYHEIFVNMKPQMNADKRRFVIAYLCFLFVTPKDFTPLIQQITYIVLMKFKYTAMDFGKVNG